MESLKRVHLYISGWVTGVGFRYSAQKFAQKNGLVGWVKNLRNGYVEIVAEGEENALQNLVDWAYKGSPLSHVDEVSVTWENPTGEFSSFEIY